MTTSSVSINTLIRREVLPNFRGAAGAAGDSRDTRWLSWAPDTDSALEGMERLENHTAAPQPLVLRAQSPVGPTGDGAYLYILVVMSFYAVFVCGIMLGYFRSKRKEKRRVNVFTRLVHELEQREWGALPTKKHSPSSPAAQVSLLCGNHGNHFGHPRFDGPLPPPLACALCTEQSSVSSLCSSADTRVTIEEEASGSAGEEQEERGAPPDPNRDDSTELSPPE